MKTHFFKRGIAGLLSLVMCLSAFIGLGTTTAFAAGEQAEVYLISFPRSGDANLDYSGTWGHSNLHYMNGWYSGESKYTTIRAMHSYDGNICYCIEPGTPQDTGDRYTSKDETFWDNLPSDFNSTISPYDMKLFIGRIMQYGYTGPISTSWRSQNASDAETLAQAMATQVLIWETVVGERDEDFNHISPGSYDAVKSVVSTAHPLYTVTFEELGVDRLFIDESHYYKNLFLFTKMRNVGGIAQTEAMKSSDLFMKCRYLDELTGGRGTVFATGTPISNSMVELYTIQRYLQYNTLVQNNLQHFDAWASTFGETITAVELTPEGYNLVGR